jgi:hypothetical protein
MADIGDKVDELLEIKEELKENTAKMKVKRDREKTLRAEILDLMGAVDKDEIKTEGFTLSRKKTKSKVKLEPNFIAQCIGEFSERRALSTENQTDLNSFLDYIKTAQEEKGESKLSLSIRKGEVTRKRKRADSTETSAPATATAPKPKKRKEAF